jgi:hypothetical protein
MTDDPELKRLQERLDTAFATARPRRGFEDELWSRLERRQPFWAHLWTGARRVNLLAYAGGVAALVVVLGLGGLVLTSYHPGGASSATSTSSESGGAKSQAPRADSASFGALPRPAVRSGTPSAAQTSPAGSPNSEYPGPVTVIAVTATIALPPAAPVGRYREPTAADADRIAANAGASPAAPIPVGALGRYIGPGYALVVLPTDPELGAEPRLLITSTRPPSAGPAADDQAAVDLARAFLGGLQAGPDPAAGSPQVVHRGALVAVLWRRVLGAAANAVVVGADGAALGWQVTVSSVTTVSDASAPAPLPLEIAQYPIADAQELARAAMAAAGGSGPQVVLDTAQLVYVVAADGAFGYFEPAVLYTGHFTVDGVQHQKRVIVPAVASSSLR